MSDPGFVLAVMGVCLLAYVVTGGADFGAGLWHLIARGPRADQQRAAIDRAIGPIWEANHVWLIFLVVLLFSAFPRGYALIATALHIPITLALVGIVLRGSAFVMEHYGLEDRSGRHRWALAFGLSSALTPVFLGMTLAALSTGDITIAAGRDLVVTSGWFAGWLTPFAFVNGLFVLALFAFLAAVYLSAERDDARGHPIAAAFRARAFVAQGVAGALAALVAWRASIDAPVLFANLMASPLRTPLLLITFCTAFAVLIALRQGRARSARVLAAVEVALITVGWGVAMDGHLVLPALRFDAAGAHPEVVAPLVVALALGGVVLAPALWWLWRLFKSDRRDRHGA